MPNANANDHENAEADPEDLTGAELLERLGFNEGPHWTRAAEGGRGEVELRNIDNIFPGTPGVYAFVQGTEIKYVGETSCIQARLGTHKSPGADRWILDQLTSAVERGDVRVFWIDENECRRKGRASLRLNFLKIDFVATDRFLLERFLISDRRPEWNRR